jgi:peptidoglycan hydrolase-like protein with peptidoglycan-binding domain
MFDLDGMMAYCRKADGGWVDPTIGGYRNHCVGFQRRAWGIDSLGASAKYAWSRVPESERHHTDPKDCPKGALCYGLFNSTYGHAWISAGGGVGYSTDYCGTGTVGRAPVNLPRWTGDSKVWWTTWTPFGHVPVAGSDKDHLINHVSAREVERALKEHGYDVDVDGTFGAGTRKAIKDVNHKHGLDSDKVHKRTLRALGLIGHKH